MIKQLIKVASELDAAGFTKEADQIDAIIQKDSRKKDCISRKSTNNGCRAD